MTRTYTPDEEAWLREHYPTLHPAELIAEHDGMFPDSPRTYKALLTRAKLLGIRKAEGYRRNPPKMWTDEKVAWFRSFVPGHSESEISAEHERLYGFPLTEGQIGNAKTKFGVKSGTHGGQFEKGSAGGFRDEGHRRAFLEAGKATRFRKGEVRSAALARKQPVGSERVNEDGYVEVKVSEGLQERPNSNFRLKHRLAYEQAYGSIPRGCNVVFADRDKSNFDPSNLVAVPRSLWAVISHEGWAYHDRDSLEACMNLARLKKAVYRARCHPRFCKRCGEEFAPRYPHQRTCDACLNR